MNQSKRKAIRREDYRAPDYLVDTVELLFELDEEATLVKSRLTLSRNHDGQRPLILDGNALELRGLRLDGRALGATDFRVNEEQLCIHDVPQRFVLEVETVINPQDNTSLEGLYKSNGTFCTQCEAEGFRKITYYLDRPDVMARFRTRIIADRARYPVLLSNGNMVASGEFEDGRHWMQWEDPLPKPCYLFALVAGDLACLDDRYETRSQRDVRLQIYVEHGNEDQCAHAIASLKRAMAWDEEVYGLEYDLDVYMIVAIGHFNMGAMENKGLNIFNTKYVLARPDTATDADYRGIEAVIGHEYFHNWTGNRVTCRDWFQLSLKEGLTVFREQEFSADMGSRAVQRIDAVRYLRAAQFPEDAGPMAHPVRPDAYIEINNFYTSTVYIKGAEVVRMIHTLLGKAGFRRGLQLYFERHDGQAVTCDDFIAAMEAANDADLSQFRLWYSQAGTPVLTINGHYDAGRRTYTLEIDQRCEPTPGQNRKLPFHIPFALGLVGVDGKDLAINLDGELGSAEPGTLLLNLHRERQTFRFHGLPAEPVPSLLRGFSAPVKVEFDYSDEQLSFLLAHDSDTFNRWEAGQRLFSRSLLARVASYRSDGVAPPTGSLVNALAKVLLDDTIDAELRAQLIAMPSEAYLGEQLAEVDVEAIHGAREGLKAELGNLLRVQLLQVYTAHDAALSAALDSAAIGQRAQRAACLEYLVATDEQPMLELCEQHYRDAQNMTDSVAALRLLANTSASRRIEALDDFYARWNRYPLLVDKWFAVQAGSMQPDTLARVKELIGHPAFSLDNPNRIRALVGTFCAGNPVCFHDRSGAGYAFLGDQVLKLNEFNPQIAARLLQPLTRWKRYDAERRSLMSQQLERILACEKLSPDVYEVAAKSLERA